MSHGLKSLAQELPQYGRYNDDMVAHISSGEAQLLKSLGGSGTINPHTGLPEFGMFGIGGGGGILGTGINKNASDPVSNALSNNPVSKAVSSGVQSAAGAVDQGLVGLDKTVGKSIPGGWGTVAQVAGSFMGLPTAAMIGLGALNGSGVLRKGGNFNLQGAIMGGAMAYGMSELGEYARGADVSGVDTVAEASKDAGNVVPSAIEVDPNIANASGSGVPNIQNVPQPSPYSSLGSSTLTQPIGAPMANPTLSADGLSPYAGNVTPIGMGGVPQSPPGILDRIGTSIANAPENAAEYISNIPGRIAEGASNAYDSAVKFADKATNLDTYTNALDKGVTNAGKTTSGIANLMGMGEGTSAAASAAAKTAATAAGTMSPITAAGLTAYGGMSLAALDQQRQYLKDQAAAGAISNAQYNQELAQINAQAEEAAKVVASNPLHAYADVNGVAPRPSLYERKASDDTLYGKSNNIKSYAMGGSISNPPDDQTDMPNQTPLQNFEQGGMYGLGSMASNPPMGYATGGMAPRFLSGGGDGMSDSIPANIGGKQEARLADGEFVVPADVVSHLGNGSSKAGAKQLYSMMDKVRQARTGRQSQGKQINPRKYMPV